MLQESLSNSKNQLNKPLVDWVNVLLVFSFLLLVLSSCTTIEIEDHEWCLDAVDEAFCFHTISENERDIPKAEWDTFRRGRISGTPEAFGALKNIIMKLCELTKKCENEEAKKIEAFFVKLSTAQVKEKVSKTKKDSEKKDGELIVEPIFSPEKKSK